eukprot:4810938-Prymnesium_polylepis.1
MLSIGSYNVAGSDNGLAPGLHPSYASTPGARAGGVLPAIAQVISNVGAKHLLSQAFPIRANIDLTLSHVALPTATPGSTWYLKGDLPRQNWSYVVTPAGAALGSAEHSMTDPSRVMMDCESPLLSREVAT